MVLKFFCRRAPASSKKIQVKGRAVNRAAHQIFVCIPTRVTPGMNKLWAIEPEDCGYEIGTAVWAISDFCKYLSCGQQWETASLILCLRWLPVQMHAEQIRGWRPFCFSVLQILPPF